MGGTKKGFHAVALRGRQVLERHQSADAGRIFDWVRSLGAVAVGVDAPCGWSRDGRARPAERELMKRNVQCFSTPTREAAENHPKGYFGWMLAGEALFKSLSEGYELFQGLPNALPVMVCFETFPHAVVCALSGGVVAARPKAETRRAMLRSRGIAVETLPNIDFIDAALCALTAHYMIEGSVAWHGEPETGLIVVPHEA